VSRKTILYDGRDWTFFEEFGTWITIDEKNRVLSVSMDDYIELPALNDEDGAVKEILKAVNSEFGTNFTLVPRAVKLQD